MERQTRQRQAVLEALSGSGRTLSPPEILALAQVQAPGLNLSTVYRQIRSLEEAGEVLKVQLPGQAARFELPCRHGHGAAAHAAEARLAAPAAAPAEAQPHHHHHFHCRVCDEVVPIHGCPGPMHELAPPGCLVEHHDLVLHGRCARAVPGAPRDARAEPRGASPLPLESGPSLLMRSAAWRLGVAGGLVGLLWLGVAWALNWKKP